MTAITIKQVEAMPDQYPTPPGTIPAASWTPDNLAALWQRIEAYTACRWTERDVSWIVEGPGEWAPPLSPATISTVEVWSGADEWTEAELSPSPLGGFFLPGCGPYRFTATVGGGSPAPEVPAAVLEAFKRLADYTAAKRGIAGARSQSVTAGNVTINQSRSPNWLAEAMQASGAADLLRPYRRVTC